MSGFFKQYYMPARSDSGDWRSTRPMFDFYYCGDCGECRLKRDDTIVWLDLWDLRRICLFCFCKIHSVDPRDMDPAKF